MNIRIETTQYNERRYGKPWIATVDFSNPKSEFSFGDWTGDHRNGGNGVLSIDANAGEILAQGQKDNRQPRNSAPTFFVVTPGGTLEDIGDKGTAYKYFLDQKNSTPCQAELEAEKSRLLARLAEVEELLK